MTTHYSFKVQVDTRWPICPNTGAVLEAISPNGQRFMGWFSTAEFNEWASSKCAAVNPESDGSFAVNAPLTAKQQRAYRGIR